METIPELLDYCPFQDLNMETVEKLLFLSSLSAPSPLPQSISLVTWL